MNPHDLIIAGWAKCTKPISSYFLKNFQTKYDCLSLNVSQQDKIAGWVGRAGRAGWAGRASQETKAGSSQKT